MIDKKKLWIFVMILLVLSSLTYAVLECATGGITSSTASTSFTLETHEPSICKFDDENVAYDLMEFSITADLATEHTAQVSNLEYDTDYTYYVLCRDEVGNENEPFVVELNLGSASSVNSEYTELFKISPDDNAQAELPFFENYPFSVACKSDIGQLSTSCVDPEQIVLKLSNPTNAHVEQGNKNNFDELVCLSNENEDYVIRCTYGPQDCEDTDFGVCVASLSGSINAHISSCTSDEKYPINICCKETKTSEYVCDSIKDESGDEFVATFLGPGQQCEGVTLLKLQEHEKQGSGEPTYTAGLPAYSSFASKLCITSDNCLNTKCEDDDPGLIRLLDKNNAHAAIPSYTDYPEKVCLSSNDAIIRCEYKDSCSEEQVAVLSVFGDYNSHVGKPDNPDASSVLCCEQIGCNPEADDFCPSAQCRGLDPDCDKATCFGGDICKVGCLIPDPDCGLGGCGAGDGCNPYCDEYDFDCGGASCGSGDACMFCDDVDDLDCSPGASCDEGDECMIGCETVDPDCGKGSCENNDGICGGGLCNPFDSNCDHNTCAQGDGCLADCLIEDPDCTLPTCETGDGCKPGCVIPDFDCLKATCKPGDVCMIGCYPVDHDCGRNNGGTCLQGDGCTANCDIPDYDCDGASCSAGDVCLVGCSTRDQDCIDLCEESDINACTEDILCQAGNVCVVGCDEVDPDCGKDNNNDCTSSQNGCGGGDKVCSGMFGGYSIDTDCGGATCEEDDACLADCETEDPDCDILGDLVPFYPEGVFEPLCCANGDSGEDENGDPYCDVSEHVDCETGQQIYVPKKHRIEFTFPPMIAAEGIAKCVITMSNDQQLVLEKTHGQLSAYNSFVLGRYLSKDDPIDRQKPWVIESCEMTSGNQVLFRTDKRARLYVHKNTWTGLKYCELDLADGVDCPPENKADAQRALYGDISPNEYFDNLIGTDVGGDVGYAYSSFRGESVEHYCYDDVTNDADDLVDGDDDDCKGITYPSHEDFWDYHTELGIEYILDGAPQTDMSNLVLDAFNSITGDVVYRNDCTGNICVGTFAIPGNINVGYWYTRNVQPNDELKVRFRFANGGNINANPGYDVVKGLSTPYVSYELLSGSGAFSYSDIKQSPTKDSFGVSGKFSNQKNDHVVRLKFSGLDQSVDHKFTLFSQWNDKYGDSPEYTFNADTNAPNTDNENDANNYESIVTNKKIKGQYNSGDISKSEHQCNDRIDNDLDYKFDCMDDQCNGEQIGWDGNNKAIKCEYQKETTCYDGYDNDHDDKVDCADEDCAGEIGGYIDAADENKIKKYLIPGAQKVYCEVDEGGPVGDASYYDKSTEQPGSCNDRFDNDADDISKETWVIEKYSCTDYTFTGDCRTKAIDCYDIDSCWGRGGENENIDTYPCPQFENNTPAWCWDGIDNDFDRSVGKVGLWLNGYDIPKPFGMLPFKTRFDASAYDGADCYDYDCRGVIYTDEEDTASHYYNKGENKYYACSYNELLNKQGIKDPAKCFDGFDNDLDNYKWDIVNGKYIVDVTGGVDCKDSDCLGVVNPENPEEICFPWEFELFKFDVCRDNIDNDYDDLVSGADNYEGYDFKSANELEQDEFNTDCKNRFNQCGVPGLNGLSFVENITYFACADGQDNDLRTGVDCEDTDCAGMIGRYWGARCGVEVCNDDFDNDGDGDIDCADENCRGQTNSRNEVCRKEEKCNDGEDNNRDGVIDCSDKNDCWGEAQCKLSDYQKECNTVPETQSATFKGVSVSHKRNQHIGEDYVIDISGSGAFGVQDIKVYLSDGNELRFPYNLENDCSIDNNEFIFEVPNYRYAIIKNKNKILDGFNVKITCNAPTSPIDRKSYTFSIFYKETAEEKSFTFNHRVFEKIEPVIDNIVVEGLKDNNVVLYYGDDFDIFAQPSDAGRGDSEDKICKCRFDINGRDTGLLGDCKTVVENNIQDRTGYEIKAKAKDSADNEMSSWKTISPINIYVKPIETNVHDDYLLDRAFYNSVIKEVDVGDFGFVTGLGDTWIDAESCKYDIYSSADESTPVMSGSLDIIKNENELTCSGIIELGDELAVQDGMYLIKVKVKDTDQDTLVSKPKIFYVCNDPESKAEDGSWTCQYYDMDNDKVPEGIYTLLYENETTAQTEVYSCDNCPYIPNPRQRDSDADGIGNVCDCEGEEESNGECNEDCARLDPDCGCSVLEYPYFKEEIWLECTKDKTSEYNLLLPDQKCDGDGECEFLEPCSCDDCKGFKDSCKIGLICGTLDYCTCNNEVEGESDGLCPADLEDLETCIGVDPDCVMKDLNIVYPREGSILKGIDEIIWEKPVQTIDHIITYDLSYSKDEGTTWSVIKSNIKVGRGSDNYFSYDWDVKGLEGLYMKYKVKVNQKIVDKAENILLQSEEPAQSKLFTICDQDTTLIHGKVTNENGGAISGAKVTATSKSTGEKIGGDVLTNADGYYEFNLDSGNVYIIDVSSGVLVAQKAEIRLEYCQSVEKNFVLGKCGDGPPADPGENCNTCITDSPCLDPLKPNCNNVGECVAVLEPEDKTCDGEPDGVCDLSETCACSDCINKRLIHKPWIFCNSDGDQLCGCYNCASVVNSLLNEDCQKCYDEDVCIAKNADIEIEGASNIITKTKIGVYKGKPVKVRVVIWN